jgi:hypothetical protein
VFLLDHNFPPVLVYVHVFLWNLLLFPGWLDRGYAPSPLLHLHCSVGGKGIECDTGVSGIGGGMYICGDNDGEHDLVMI